MPRPAYTNEQLTQLTNQYQQAAYPYISGLLEDLADLENDPERPVGSPAYRAEKAHLNSQVYLMTQYAMDARQNIALGYPTKFHPASFQALSNRMLEDPEYARIMMEHTFEQPENELLERQSLHAFREELDEALPERYRNRPLAADVLPPQGRSSRAIVYRQVLNELDATGTGYYIPGISRGSNSESFENVKTELRRQIALLEGGMPLSSADDDRMIQVLDAYSNRKYDTRTRGFGNTRARSIQKAYAEIARNPAPRAANAQPLPTAQEISSRYNNARGLDPQRHANHVDYVDLTRDDYRVTPARTLQDEYNAAVARMRQITTSRMSGNPYVPAQQTAYANALMRAVCLQTLMIRDPAGPNAAVNEHDVEILMRTVREHEAVTGAIVASNRDAVHMNEITYGLEHGYNPAMTAQYHENPADYHNSLFNNLRTASVPNINERLQDAKGTIRALPVGPDHPLTEPSANVLRQQAARVIAMTRLKERSEMDGNDHVTGEQLDAEVQAVLNEFPIDEAIRVCQGDPRRASALAQILRGDNNTLGVLTNAVQIASRGGILDEIRRQYDTLAELEDAEYGPEQQQTAEENLVRLAALLRVRDAHKDDADPNPGINEAELQTAIQQVHQDHAFMDAIQGKITNAAQMKAAGQNLAMEEFHRHYSMLKQYARRFANEPNGRDFLTVQMENSVLTALAVRSLQQRAGSENIFITPQQLADEEQRVALSDEFLAVQRALLNNNVEPIATLLDRVFNRPYDQYAQNFLQHVRPMIRRYPYPEPGPGTLGALYNQVHQEIPADPVQFPGLTGPAGRQNAVDVVVRHLALRQMALEDPQGPYAPMTPAKQARYNQLQQQIRQDYRYIPLFNDMLEGGQKSVEALRLASRGIDLNALKARQNRDLSGDFIDPVAGGLARMTAAEWAEFERNGLAELTADPNKQWTAVEKDGLIWKYARMHEAYQRNVDLPDQAEALIPYNQLNNSGTQYLQQPGVRAQLEEIFADPSKAMSCSILNRRVDTLQNETLSEPDKLAHLMALGKLEKGSFPDRLIPPSVLQAEVEKVRQENSYKRLAGYLEAGHTVRELPVLAGNNYYDAMVQNSYMLPGMQQDYPTRLSIIAGDAATKMQQGDPEGAALEMVKLYMLKQYQKDGWTVDDLPAPAEFDRIARELAKTDDFHDAIETMKAQPQRMQTILQAAGDMDADGIAQILMGYALQARPDNTDLREPNFLHELRAQQMYDAYTRLEQGNAGDAWTSEAEKNARRDDYLRFTALNRILTDDPNRAYIPESEIQAGIQELQNDADFMEMLNNRLARPNMLRFTVFNSAGVLRWSETRTLGEHRKMLREADAAMKDGRAGFEHAFGSVPMQLLDIIDARLSGRERNNETLSTRDLNMSKNDLLYSDRYRSIENAIRADVSNFDRVENILKLPADQFQDAYNKLTDEFMQKYPSVPMRDENTLGYEYDQALARIKQAANEDPRNIANDEQRRTQVISDIKTVLMDRRILIKAPIDTQLMRRSLSAYDSPTQNAVLRVKEHEQEMIDRFTGNLDERFQENPNVLAQYLQTLSGAEDLRELQAKEYHTREPFADPLVGQLRQAGLAAPVPTREQNVSAITGTIRQAPIGETTPQRQQRLSAQMARLVNEMLLKDLPDDELPTAAERAQQEAFIQTLPGYKDAIAHLAKDPQALDNLLQDAESGLMSPAEFVKQLDLQASMEQSAADPQHSHPNNMLFYLRKETMHPYQEGVSVNSTGDGMAEWKKEQREKALDFCVRCTAVNKLLADNPDRVYFSEAEIKAASKKVAEDKEYIRMLENDAPNGTELRKNFFGYTGIMYWENINGAIGFAEQSIVKPQYADAFVPAGWRFIAEKIPYKRSGAIDNNEADVTAEKDQMYLEYSQTKEFEVLLRAFKEDPTRLKRYILEVFTLPRDEFDEAHKAFAQEMAALYHIDLEADAPQANGDDLDLEINGMQQNIQEQDAFKQMEAEMKAEEAAHERELNGEEDMEEEVDALDGVDLEGEQGEPQAVGWPQFEEAAPIQNKPADGAFYNSQKGVLDGQLRLEMANPMLVKAAVENLYLIAVLKKQGIDPTPDAVSNARESLQGDAAFQKFLKKCMGERSFAREQLNGAFASPDADKMRAEMNKLTPDAFERTKEQIAMDLQQGRIDAQFEHNFRKLYAMSQMGDAANDEAAVEQRAGELAQNQNLNKIFARLKEDPKTHQQGLQPGFGYMLLNGVFKTCNPQNVVKRVGMVANGLENEKHGEAHYLEQYGPKQPVIRVPAKGLVPNSPEAEFQKALAKLDEDARERTLKQNAGFDPAMSQQEKGRFFMQTCKTVALYNLAQSPQYKGKELPENALKAEMLRLKDDPAMQQTMRKAIEDPAVHKTLADGMVRTFNDPITFTSFVKNMGQAPQQSADWLANSYPDPLPKLQTSLYKPYSNVYGSPKLPGIRVRSDKFVMPKPATINENEVKFLELKDELVDNWKNYKTLNEAQRANQKEVIAESMAKVYAMRQLMAVKGDQQDAIDDLDEKLERRTDLLMKDPAFRNVTKSSVDDPRNVGDAMVRMLSGNFTFTNLTNQLQSRSDNVYCDANQIDIQTGKKIVQQQQPQQGVQQGGPVA